MKKISLPALALGVVVLITACGPSGKAAAPETAQTSPPETTPAVTEAPAPAGEETPASSGELGEVLVIELKMHTNGYDPSLIRVKPGSQVRFNISNIDVELHDLWSRRAKFDVEVSANRSKIYDWTAPQQKRTYVVECTLHEGLILEIIVE